MKKIFDLIISYKLVLIKILYFEIFHILLGYKGNNFNIRNETKTTDTIPCPYYFLTLIYRVIDKENIRSFVDLGCGNGRVLFFFNKKKPKISYVGVELFKNSFDTCVKILKNYKNIQIFNKNFFDLDFHKKSYDCYFLNDPLKTLEDHNKMINKIIISHHALKRDALFVLVNLTQGKYAVFKNQKLIFNYNLNSRNIRIYKYKFYQ